MNENNDFLFIDTCISYTVKVDERRALNARLRCIVCLESPPTLYYAIGLWAYIMLVMTVQQNTCV